MKVGPCVRATCSTFEANHKLKAFIQSHPFAHQLDVLRPKWEGGPQDLPGLPEPAEDSVLFVTSQLSAFLDLQFLESVVDRLGVEFRAISVDGTLDPGDAVAITASGQLHLRLSKDSYQKVGLLGSKSKGNKDHYHVHVDLTSKNFRQRGQHYHRVLSCLESCECPMDFVCSREGGEHLLGSPHVSFSQVIPNTITSKSFACQLPQLEKLQRPGPEHPTKKLDPLELDYALGWIGRLSVGSQEALVQGDENCRAGTLETQRWTGLVLPSHVEACIASLRASVVDGSLPWAAAVVTGFASAAVTWVEDRQGSNPFLEGSKDYVLLLLPGDQFISMLLSGGNQT